MCGQGRFDAFVPPPRFLDFADSGVELECRRERQNHHIIQMHGEIGKLQLRGKQVLFGYEGLRPAFDKMFIQRF